MCLLVVGGMEAKSNNLEINGKWNGDVSGVCIVVWGVRWGPPWSQMIDICVLDIDWVGWDKKMLNMRILGSGVGFLPMKIVAKWNGDVSEVCIVVWGVRWGPPWSQMIDICVLDTDGVGWGEKMLNMRILGPGVGFLYLVVVPEDVVF